LRIACEYWKSRKINDCADKDDVVAVTKKINGGTNGIADRRTCLAVAKKMWADNYESDMVPVPKVEKTMVESKQGNAALVTGALGGVAAAKEVVAQAQEASDLFGTVLGLLKNTQFLMMAAIVLAGSAIWFWRKKHLEEHGI
jgi:predicted chitinase